MYEWDLSAIDRGCRLVVSRVALDVAAAAMVTIAFAFCLAYSLWHTDITAYPVQAVIDAGLLALLGALIVWLLRRPHRIIFIAEFDTQAGIASLSETSATRSCSFNRRFDEITSIDTVLFPASLFEKSRIQRFGMQFTFSDGTIFKPAGYDNDPTGKIRLFISDIRDFTGIAGAPAPDIKPNLWDWFDGSRLGRP